MQTRTLPLPVGIWGQLLGLWQQKIWGLLVVFSLAAEPNFGKSRGDLILVREFRTLLLYFRKFVGPRAGFWLQLEPESL